MITAILTAWDIDRGQKAITANCVITGNGRVIETSLFMPLGAIADRMQRFGFASTHEAIAGIVKERVQALLELEPDGWGTLRRDVAIEGIPAE